MVISNKRNQSVRFAVSILITFLMCMALTSWVATQYLASLLEYQSGLGSAALDLGAGRKLYQPFSWVLWNLEWMHVEGRLQDFLTRTQFIVVLGALISVVIAVYLSYRRSMKTEMPDDLHGSARWATAADVQKMGLMARKVSIGSGPLKRMVKVKPEGVYVGAFETPDGRMVLRYDEAAHLLAYMPSRSGKGVGLVLPTLLSYPNSTATNDIKGENFELSSGFRHTAGTLVIRFDPTALDGKSIDGKTGYNVACQWNVMDEIRVRSDFDVMDAQNIAAAIADPNGEGMDDHWVSTSYELLVGVILHVLYFERDKSLTGVATYLADPSFTDPEQMYNRMMDAEHDPAGVLGWLDSSGKPTKTHPQVALSARSMLNKEEKERNSVLSTAKTKLALYTEPIVARNTSRSDFRVADLMNHDRPVSLYLVVPPSDKERLRPLIRLFLTFLIRRLTNSMAFEDGASAKEYKHRLLLLIDELASLKKMETLQDALSYMAGYGITAYLFVQDVIQLKEAYGDKETVSAGCQIRIASAPNTLDTAEDLSKMTGVETRKRQNVSYSGSRLGSMLGQMSVSEELLERPLMTGDEIMRLPRDECLIFNAGHPPIRGKKLQYFKMEEFLTRARIATPSRVSMSFRDDERRLQSKWFMVLCERRDSKDKSLRAVITVYAEFPPLRVVVKQENLETETLQEFEFELVDAAGQPVRRVLTNEDHEFTLRPVGDASAFQPQEAWEVHFLVADASQFPEFTQKGFFRDISVHERAARRTVREHFFKVETETGQKREPAIELPAGKGRYQGAVLLETDQYVAVVRNGDMVSLHRKSKLNRIPAVGSEVTITYKGKRGEVL